MVNSLGINWDAIGPAILLTALFLGAVLNAFLQNSLGKGKE